MISRFIEGGANLLLLCKFSSVYMVRLSLAREHQRSFFRLLCGSNFASGHEISRFQESKLCNKPFGSVFFSEFSTIRARKLKTLSPASSILLRKLEKALRERNMAEAWEMYRDFKQLYGFPDQLLLSNLINESSYSADSTYLRKACDLVLTIVKEKPVLVSTDAMSKLALSLARAQIPVPASNVLRSMLEKSFLPSLDVLQLLFLHLVKTEVGMCVASNILEEIFCCFEKLQSVRSNASQPDVAVFNLVLDACVRFGSPLKGQRVMELMARTGVVGDAHTVVIIARLHEMNGTRDELRKFKDYVDTISVSFMNHYQHFYNSLLSLHFKFNDFYVASSLLMELCKYCESNSYQSDQIKHQKPIGIPIGSENVKSGLRLQFYPCQIQKDCVYKMDTKPELVFYKGGRFFLTKKGLAKLVIGYKRNGNISSLSKVLINIQNMIDSTSPCSDVIDSCIHLGWLETAHDIIDDMESEKQLIRKSSYELLLTSYRDNKMFKEAEAFVRQIKRVDTDIDRATMDSKESTLTRSTNLVESIVQNMRNEGKEIPGSVLKYNSSIYFFAKTKMIGDALGTYHKMQKAKIQPNSNTYFYLISGYSSLEMYREIAFLWGDIKRSMKTCDALPYDRDLYELLLLSFIRRGYFERVMEVIGIMRDKDMFLDRWCYKYEFLKFHRDLYRRLSTSDAKDETQRKRMGHVLDFRKFVGVG